MATPYPEFYVEQGTSIPFGNTAPLFGHALWRLPNVYPEINGTVGIGQHDGWAFTASGLASGILTTYNYFKRNLEASGVGMPKYAFKIAGIGNGSYGAATGLIGAPTGLSTKNLNSIWLMNDQRDMVGATGHGTAFQDNLAPWAPTGIANMLAWGSGFWPLLKSIFTASGIPSPSIMGITTENIPDDTRGFVFGGTGWVNRALADPRSSSVLFDGVRTFTSYWNNTTGYIDGTAIPTGLVNIGSWQYIPENEKLRHKYHAAWLMGQSYATYQGIIAPFEAQFGAIPTVEYTIFASSSGSPVPRTYPGQPEYLVTNFYHTAQGPDWYSNFPHQYDSSEDDVAPYQPSVTGWIRTYPRPETVTNYTPSGYAMLKYGQEKASKALGAYPSKPVIPFLSTEGNSNNISMMVDFIKYCLSVNINKFYIFEGDTLTGTANADIWRSIIAQVNNYVDYLNNPINSYKCATVCRFGGGFLKF